MLPVYGDAKLLLLPVVPVFGNVEFLMPMLLVYRDVELLATVYINTNMPKLLMFTGTKLPGVVYSNAGLMLPKALPLQ